MSILDNPLLLAHSTESSSYTIERSLRFNSADSTYLKRTPSQAGNRKTWTFSVWVKRLAPTTSATEPLLYAANGVILQFTNNQLQWWNYGNWTVTTSNLYVDASAWYHIVFVLDTTQSTAANRFKIYVNNVLQSTSGTYPTLNFSDTVNSTAAHCIGCDLMSGNPNNVFSGYLADIYLIDGLALTPSSFGQTDANGVWQPKAYGDPSGYGTNGFKLKFTDNSAVTAVALGKDTSGNSLNWTPYNFSVSAGAGNDSLVDTPSAYGTDSGVGGEVRGNYATLNPHRPGVGTTLKNGNLDYSSITSGAEYFATIGITSGKWYWEVVTTAGTTQTKVGVYGSAASTLYSLAANNTVYGIRFDADAGTLDYTSNGSTWTSLETNLTSGPYFPYFKNSGTTGKTVSVNFGQRPFTYVAPSSYKVLCTKNLTDTTVTTSGSYIGNASVDGPSVWTNGIPLSMTINGNAVTFGTHVYKLSYGFKVITILIGFNHTDGAVNNYTVTSVGAPFLRARAQVN